MKENNNQNQNQNDNQSRQILLSVLAVAILVVAVVGVSFAAFTYSKSGDQTNTITTGTITMEYTEDGPYIAIDNAMPIADASGKAITESNLQGAGTTGTVEGQEGTPGGVFDFTVKATITGTTTINYQIGVEKVAVTTSEPQAPEYAEVGVKAIPDDMVKLYLEKDEAGGENYTEVATTTGGEHGVKTYDELADGTGQVPATQKVLGSGTFTESGTTTHTYRLRMWVSDKFDMNDLNDDKTVPGKILTYKGQFKVKVNVYGKAA